MSKLEYQVINIDNLFKVQDEEILKNLKTKQGIEELRAKNKKELLKIALPFIHGVFALHNRKCKNEFYPNKHQSGLLSDKRIDIKKEIRFIVSTDSSEIWNEDFTTLSVNVSSEQRVKIWLHTLGKPVHNNNLRNYSMQSVNFLKNKYGTSVEEELIEVAKNCAQFTDDWKK
tara:strand:+ start:2446 stop:2961 length:516 start_codon:yes stop_codon:yes gene_type:complete